MPDYIRVPLSQGKYALIDPEDAERVLAFKWSALIPNPKRSRKHCYAVRGDYTGPRRTMVYLHRFIMDAPKGMEVDHKNGDGLDCRRSNLRLASRSQNAANFVRENANRWGYRGVFKSGPRWGAACQVGDMMVRVVGAFETKEEAARAYDELASRLHGEFAVLNFPREGRTDA